MCKKAEERMILPLLSLLYPPPKLSVSHIRFGLADSHIDSLSLTDDHDPAFGTGDGGVEKIAFQQRSFICVLLIFRLFSSFIIIDRITALSNYRKNITIGFICCPFCNKLCIAL